MKASRIMSMASLAALSATAQVSSYDMATAVLTIPSISVGESTYTNVTLRNRGDFVFEVTGLRPQLPVAAPGVARYDIATGVLAIPAVKAGDATYLDVRLLFTPQGTLKLQSAAALPQSVVDEVTAFARSGEALVAKSLPSSGAARSVLNDSCWASNGRTRASFIADYDANLGEYLQRDAYIVGRRYENIQVQAVRELVNPDGSARREIDVQWDVVYRDGTSSLGETQRLISGSSAGTPGCTSPQTGSTLRNLGNQQLVQTAVRAHNQREERYSIANGAPLAPLVRFRREVQFIVGDPMGNATYVIVTGPGPGNTVAGKSWPFSMKFVSPRLLRSAPEFLGKTGNFVNWADDDTFRNCRMADGSVPVAPVVDCVAQGGNSNSWGIGYTDAANAVSDANFSAQGWEAGGSYRFDVYNDDGWKTVNGQAGKTPIATYYAVLDRLPRTFVEMASANAYPVITLDGATPAQVVANVTSATPAPLALQWTRPSLASGWRPVHLFMGWEFHQGPQIGNAAGVLNPGYRTLNSFYPGTTATSSKNVPVTPKQGAQASKTYTEFMLWFAEPGTSNTIQSRILFQ